MASYETIQRLLKQDNVSLAESRHMLEVLLRVRVDMGRCKYSHTQKIIIRHW